MCTRAPSAGVPALFLLSQETTEELFTCISQVTGIQTVPFVIQETAQEAHGPGGHLSCSLPFPGKHAGKAVGVQARLALLTTQCAHDQGGQQREKAGYGFGIKPGLFRHFGFHRRPAGTQGVPENAFSVFGVATTQESRKIIQDASVVVPLQGVGQPRRTLLPSGVSGQGGHERGKGGSDGLLPCGLIHSDSLADLSRLFPGELLLEHVQK